MPFFLCVSALETDSEPLAETTPSRCLNPRNHSAVQKMSSYFVHPVNYSTMRTSIRKMHCQGTYCRDCVHLSLIWCHFSVYAGAKAPRLMQIKPSTPRHYAHHHLHPERVTQSVATRFGLDQMKPTIHHRVRIAEKVRIRETHVRILFTFFLHSAITDTSLWPVPRLCPLPLPLVMMAVQTDPCSERFRSFVNA